MSLKLKNNCYEQEKKARKEHLKEIEIFEKRLESFILPKKSSESNVPEWLLAPNSLFIMERILNLTCKIPAYYS